MSQEQVQTETVVDAINEPESNIKLKCPEKENQSTLALKELQLEIKAIDREFFEKIYAMETEYQMKYDLIFKKRFDIINAEYLPTEGKCDSLESDILKHEEIKDSNAQVQSTDQKELDNEPVTPASASFARFWLNVLSATVVRLEILEYDEQILEHLIDIRSRNKPLPDLGFFLEFHFSPNKYFENPILTKEYFFTLSYGNPMVHNGPLIYKSVGCEIKWKDGKAPSSSSFFDYFSSNRTVCTKSNSYIVIEEGFRDDFELGRFLKEHLISRAFVYFNEDQNDVSECSTVVGSDDDDDDDEEINGKSNEKISDENLAEDN